MKKSSPPSSEPHLSYNSYFRDRISLATFKITELKQLAKHHGLTQVGNKGPLIDKIHTYFLHNARANTLQRIVRGHWTRQWMSPQLRGTAFRTPELCVNDTDFYTMDPLVSIPAARFVTYTDAQAFTYGFDLHSLVIYRNKGNTMNPYNRSEIPVEVHVRLHRLYALMRIVCPDGVLEGEKEYQLLVAPDVPFPRRRRRVRTRVLTAYGAPTDPALPPRTVALINRYQNDTLRILSATHSMGALGTALDTKSAFMQSVRRKPASTRIQELFMEIDMLGNYTSASWFSQLNITGLHAFYRQLMDIWRFMAHIPYDVKHRICPLEDPFSSAPMETGNDRNLEFMQCLCLHAMENMVFSGLDIEYRKLGAMHVLTALTVVSLPCRNTMFWLYETLF